MAERRRRQEKARLAKVEERRRAARAAAPQRRGRPIDLASERQRKLAEHARLIQEDPEVRACACVCVRACVRAFTVKAGNTIIMILLFFDPEVRAQRQRDSDAAAIEAKVARWCEIWRRHDERRCEATLSHVPEEQRAEAERLFWEHARLSRRADVAARLRSKHNRLGQCPSLATVAPEAKAAALKLRTYISGEPLPPAWDTEGQCEGLTRCGKRCKVHRSCRLDVANPLRRGERLCGHHHPSKYTGVRCAGIKKHGKGQCRVWSGSCYADAAPLRRGSLYCHHHRVQCAGQTRAGVRCTVTSSSQHEHAAPLRQGQQFCVHHQHPASRGDESRGNSASIPVSIAQASIEPAPAQGAREDCIASVARSLSEDDSESDYDPSSGGWGSVESSFLCSGAPRPLVRFNSRESWEYDW